MKPPLLEEVARSAGGVVAGEQCSPLRCMFRNCIKPRTGNNNSPEGGTGGCCRRDAARFSPLDRGVRLSSEPAAALHK